MAGMLRLTVHRSPLEAWGDAWGFALRFPPSRWLLGALLLPGTPARSAALELHAAAWERSQI